MTHADKKSSQGPIVVCRFCSKAFLALAPRGDRRPGAPVKRCSACATNLKRAAKKLQGTVYFLEAEGFGRIKIGFTRENVERRAMQLQVGCPAPIKILRTLEGTMKDEKKLHRRFATQRVPHTEWFVADEKLRSFVEGLQP
jgi:hypothetical protein